MGKGEKGKMGVEWLLPGWLGSSLINNSRSFDRIDSPPNQWTTRRPNLVAIVTEMSLFVFVEF